jgi:hypothetical protein
MQFSVSVSGCSLCNLAETSVERRMKRFLCSVQHVGYSSAVTLSIYIIRNVMKVFNTTKIIYLPRFKLSKLCSIAGPRFLENDALCKFAMHELNTLLNVYA